MKKTYVLVAALSLLCGACSKSDESAEASNPLAASLPAGDSRDLVANACSTCHDLNLITDGTGHTPEDWQLTVDRMSAAGAAIAPGQDKTVSDYLAKNFPEHDVPTAVIVDGPVKVSFQEWTLPTRGSRPHDPLAAHDGTIWYTGMYASALGRIDPATGEIKEFRPPKAGSGPHGLTEDKAGNIWFTANSLHYIGKLDPKSGQFTEYPLPGGTGDPHTPIFDPKGILWFTVQRANKIGRLDPATGDIKMVDSPTARSLPYGMVIDSKGAPYYCEFGSNKIARVDPATMEVKEWTLPRPESRPRRIAITPDDKIYYADFATGYLGRLDPATGDVKEWMSPSGPRSQPYGITVVNGIVWYSESAVKPNTMVRFDPKTESFQTWAIPAGGGVVRNMMTTRDGNIAIAESAKNIVGLMTIAK